MCDPPEIEFWWAPSIEEGTRRLGMSMVKKTVDIHKGCVTVIPCALPVLSLCSPCALPVLFITMFLSHSSAKTDGIISGCDVLNFSRETSPIIKGLWMRTASQVAGAGAPGHSLRGFSQRSPGRGARETLVRGFSQRSPGRAPQGILCVDFPRGRRDGGPGKP